MRYRWAGREHDGDNPYATYYLLRWRLHVWNDGAVHVDSSLPRFYWRPRALAEIRRLIRRAV